MRLTFEWVGRYCRAHAYPHLDSVTYKCLVKQKSKFYSKHPGKRPTAGGDVGKHFRILVLELCQPLGVGQMALTLGT